MNAAVAKLYKLAASRYSSVAIGSSVRSTAALAPNLNYLVSIPAFTASIPTFACSTLYLQILKNEGTVSNSLHFHLELIPIRLDEISFPRCRSFAYLLSQMRFQTYPSNLEITKYCIASLIVLLSSSLLIVISFQF